MGSCMANLDHAALEAMEAKSEAFEKDRQRLCQAGQRDAALQRARRFGLAMRSDPLRPEPGHPRSDRERIMQLERYRRLRCTPQPSMKPMATALDSPTQADSRSASDDPTSLPRVESVRDQIIAQIIIFELAAILMMLSNLSPDLGSRIVGFVVDGDFLLRGILQGAALPTLPG